MATKLARKTLAVKARVTKTSSAKTSAAKTSTAKSAGRSPANNSNARKAVLAGIGAVNRVQGEAVKVYGLIAAEAQRLSDMTSEAAEALAKKAGVYAREGKKIQSHAVAIAQGRAAETAKEVKAFALKSEKSLKQNIAQTMSNAVTGAKEGVTQLEHIFETRVAKTLSTFGIPSHQDVRALQLRMADLQKALNQLNKRGVRI